jgi:hypothetical protein
MSKVLNIDLFHEPARLGQALVVTDADARRLKRAKQSHGARLPEGRNYRGEMLRYQGYLAFPHRGFAAMAPS